MKENLQSKTVKELRDIAKTYNISGRWDMSKSNLIEAILRAEESKEVGVQSVKEEQSATEEVRIEAVAEDEEKSKEDYSNSKFEYDIEQKMPYIEQAKPGTLVAFKLSNGKVKSAKIVRKSSTKRMFKLETQYGAVFIVPYENILWVRTGSRWPKGIYNLLKGIS